MARLLIKAFESAGHEASEISTFRSYLPTADGAAFRGIQRQSRSEADRIAAQWQQSGPPGLWFTYHPYYKAPDLLGPGLCRAFAIPYATAEASYSPRRNRGAWSETQAWLVEGLDLALVNFCFTERDHAGLAAIAPTARFDRIAPFIDTAGFVNLVPARGGARLITVAMMREGDKFQSFRMLAAALELIGDTPWTLTIVGGGPLRKDVEALFADFAPGRLHWIGEVTPEAVPALLSDANIYVWPGCGEAYGLAYLEAQAAGLPVIAQNTAGVPEVVRHGETGYLTPEGDVMALAAAIRRLLSDEPCRQAMAANARRLVFSRHSLPQAAARLAAMMDRIA